MVTPKVEGIDHEIRTDGRTVWINDRDGTCVGRFSRFGIDVHGTLAQQRESDTQCLDCTHEEPDEAGWQRFRAAMTRHHAIVVDEDVRPEWLQSRDTGEVTPRGKVEP